MTPSAQPHASLPLIVAVATMIGGCGTSGLTLESLRPGSGACYDRSSMDQTSLVDTHLHFRPFGGPAIPFEEVVSYLTRSGVLFANIYGIGQMLPVSSPCTYYLDCPGTPVVPKLTNDVVNAANVVTLAPEDVHLTLSMTFPDLSNPESILRGIQLLDTEFPDMFTWMGEVNLVKQALFNNGHQPVSSAAIKEWAVFMDTLRQRDIPLAIHADLGNDQDPVRYLPVLKEVLQLYPDNKIVWMHMGLSKELANMDVREHIQIIQPLLDRYPNLMIDIAWRMLEDNYFSRPERRRYYIPFLNAYSDRVLPGTDFVAAAGKDYQVYETELQATSRINRHLNDAAFRNIALGQNYFRLLGLDYEAPPICLN